MKLWPNGAPLAMGTEPSDCPELTPYLIDTKKSLAGMIVCPGGGYWMRADHEGEPIARWLNRIGIHAFVLDYRVAPYRHPAPLMDAARAIRYVRANAENFHTDPYRIGILGFSAGGHLAATAGTGFDRGNPLADDPIERMSSRPDLMVLCYPVISFSEFGHTGSMKNLLGENPSREVRRKLSAELQVTADTPPAFLWHTADDSVVSAENSILMAQALSKHGIPFELHIFASGRHGLGLAEAEPETKRWPELCELWLRKRGF
ncbi:MAG TPA: alpha/beta hydrolase [Bacilli bacterium]